LEIWLGVEEDAQTLEVVALPWGWGRGWGWRWWFLPRWVPGWWGFAPYYPPYYPKPEDELKMLEELKADLERELEDVTKRIEELKKEMSG